MTWDDAEVYQNLLFLCLAKKLMAWKLFWELFAKRKDTSFLTKKANTLFNYLEAKQPNSI